MPRINRPKRYQVILTDHAWERYQERGGKRIGRTRLARLIEARLNDNLGPGLYIDPTGATWVEITPWLWASLRLIDKGWNVTTIIDFSEKREAAG